ncbi:hypothetical protein KQI63_04955 [bacterium]|nr:hypothetical protein [bacterium]
MKNRWEKVLIVALLALVGTSVSWASSVELKPYGFVRFEAARDNSELARGDWMLYNYNGNSSQQDEQVLTMTGRHTRIGIKLSDPEMAGNWNVKGVIEVDFAGGFPNSSTASRQPLLRLRHAWIGLANQDWEIRMGQDWALLSTPFPRTANFVVGAANGNLWMRMPQIRVSTVNKPVNFAVSLNRAIDGNNKYDSFTSSDLDPIGEGERTGLPWVMGRVWFGPKNFTVSVFGHYGTEASLDTNDVAHDVSSWSMNGSIEAKAGKFTIVGKGFYGTNLNSFFGGIIQGIVQLPNSVETINSSGGWGYVSYAINDKWSCTAGMGIDNPESDYLSVGSRELNTWIFGNAGFKPKSNLNFMLEADYMETQYGDPTPAGENIRVIFATVYSF